MPDFTRDKKDILKLVYPQRRVEIHTQPITAADVMKRNPRHCVARPDVFKHPWVIVKPESVLFPGKVFYIVPKRTIHNLLKARDQNKDQTDQKPSQYNKLKSQNLDLGQAFQNKLGEGVSSDEEDSDCGEVEQCYPNSRRSFELSKHEKVMEKKAQRCHRYSTSTVPSQIGIPDRVIKLLKQENGLKSCLRKHNSSRKTLNLRVTFVNTITIRDAGSPYSSENCECSHS